MHSFTLKWKSHDNKELTSFLKNAPCKECNLPLTTSQIQNQLIDCLAHIKEKIALNANKADFKASWLMIETCETEQNGSGHQIYQYDHQYMKALRWLKISLGLSSYRKSMLKELQIHH